MTAPHGENSIAEKQVHSSQEPILINEKVSAFVEEIKRLSGNMSAEQAEQMRQNLQKLIDDRDESVPTKEIERSKSSE